MFGNSSVRIGTQVLFPPVLENIRPALSPDPTDCPWVPEDERLLVPRITRIRDSKNTSTFEIHLAAMLLFGAASL